MWIYDDENKDENNQSEISPRKSSIVFLHLGQSSGIFDSLCGSPEIIGNCRKVAETTWYTKQTDIDLFEADFVLDGKNYWYSELYTVSIKMPKILLFLNWLIDWDQNAKKGKWIGNTSSSTELSLDWGKKQILNVVMIFISRKWT